MRTEAAVRRYWQDVAQQKEEALREYFTQNACIRWHNTDEQFTAEEFIRANCDYPGDWQGEVERIVASGDTLITVTHVWSKDISTHAVSFFALKGEQIETLDEYWGEDGAPPQWRLEMRLGRPIHER